MPEILPDIVDEAARLLAAAEERGVTLRLLGGVAVRLRAAGLCAPSTTLSSTLRKGKSRRRSRTCARPSPTVRWAGSPSMRFPRNVIWPARGATRPEMVFMSVDLPAPFGPRIVKISRSPTCIAACHRTWKSP